MNKTYLLKFYALLTVLLPVLAQGEELPDSLPSEENREILNLSIEEAIARARANSVDAAASLDRLRTAYWEYRYYRANLLPEISFKATLPAYFKQYSTYIDSNGNPNFVPNNYLQMTGELSMTQKIWLTGGEISMSTSLDFLRQFGQGAYNRFMSIPVAISLRQPIFAANDVKWDRRIQPLRYAEAKARFLSESEEVAMQAVGYYFKLIMARENLEIARQNLENADKLYEVALEKRKMGRISGNDLLQMELNLLSARAYMTDTESDLRACMFALQSFLGIGESVEIWPVIPDEVPAMEIDYQSALSKALANNSHSSNIRRRMIEADYNVAQAKGEMREITLFAQVGYSGTESAISRAYTNLRDNQLLQIGFELPLIDWGKRKGKVRVAESNRRLVENTLQRENQEFRQNLFILVERFGNQRERVAISRRADEIASRRYNANVETYMIGAISTLDLNDSRVNKDEARREYVNQLYLYWHYYYQLRSLTLWDYAKDAPLDEDLDSILK